MARAFLPVLVLSVLWSTTALCADLKGKLRVSTGAGVDTNARRDADVVGHVSDGLVSFVGEAEGRATFDSWQLSGSYEGGVRKFILYPSEDVLVQSANGEGSIAIGRFAGVGVRGRVRDRRGGDRDYSDLAASAFVEFVPDATLDVQVYGTGHRFIYWGTGSTNDFRYSFAAPEVGATARYRFDKRHSVVVFGELALRNYNGFAEFDPAIPEADRPPPQRREDSAFSVGAGYALKGPIPLAVTYSYFDQSSNSFGETLRRHRLSATAAFRLPWRFFLFAQAQAQLSSYPEGFRISPELVLDEDAENHNAFSLKLVRPVAEVLDVEARFAWYQNVLPHFAYHRQLYWMGLTWRR